MVRRVALTMICHIPWLRSGVPHLGILYLRRPKKSELPDSSPKHLHICVAHFESLTSVCFLQHQPTIILHIADCSPYTRSCSSLKTRWPTGNEPSTLKSSIDKFKRGYIVRTHLSIVYSAYIPSEAVCVHRSNVWGYRCSHPAYGDRWKGPRRQHLEHRRLKVPYASGSSLD